MGAEDFSYMLEARPGAFIFVGNGDTAGLHHPAYNFNDELIPVGVVVLGEAGGDGAARVNPLPRGEREPAPAADRTYSITSSTRNSTNESATVSPSALAVLRLSTRSNLVGSSTGSSAGLAPLRIRPV